MKRITSYLAIIGLLFASCSNKQSSSATTDIMDNELTMVVGTYTYGESKGIYTFRFDQETGETKALSEAAISNPSYLTISGDNKFIYAVSEHGDGSEAVTAFAFDKEMGTLRQVNSQPAMGADPCHITTNDKCVITANYSGGNIAIFPISDDGALLPALNVIEFTGSGPDKVRQEKSHLHCVQFTPDGKYLFANDLGADCIYSFEMDEQADAENGRRCFKKGVTPVTHVKGGSGPRHITFSSNGKYAYIINELSGTVIAFEHHNGQLVEIQSIHTDELDAPRGSGDIHISPDGKFLYASNRLRADGIAIFRINETDGKLVKEGYQVTGSHPRNFNITPNGKFLLVACRDSDAIEVYRRHEVTGMLARVQQDIKVDKPVCIKFCE